MRRNNRGEIRRGVREEKRGNETRQEKQDEKQNDVRIEDMMEQRWDEAEKKSHEETKLNESRRMSTNDQPIRMISEGSCDTDK